jgi:uncharacterized membrane protein YdbT with pleckstrin-like domain
MDYVASLLGENEKIVFLTRRHWIVFIFSMLINSLLMAAIIIVVLGLQVVPTVAPFAWFLLIFLIIPLFRLGKHMMFWYNEQYIITNRRVIQAEGIINKKVIDSSLEKVNDVVLTQSVIGRLLGYGDVEILTASELGANKFERIGNPVGFKTTMLNQKEHMTINEDFSHKSERVLEGEAPTAGDVPELIAELDELRKKGIITDEEFARKKADLLNKI